MNEDVLQKYIEAGRIAATVREEALRLIKPGARLLDICEYVERRIAELGGRPAFPCNISVNEVAAHYTPPIGDESRIPEEAVVKLDLGVHIDGYIADTAATVDTTGKWEKLLEAVREALEHALETVKPGAAFSETSRVIENTIKSHGFMPVANLGGHSLGRYIIHAGESIPNAYEPSLHGAYRVGHAYAIEPFGTNGVGYVDEGELVTIYALLPVRRRGRLDSVARKVLKAINERFKTLPFTERWLADVTASVDALRAALRRLARSGYLIEYPILVERSRGVVAQFEHTVVLTDDGEAIVTTMLR